MVAATVGWAVTAPLFPFFFYLNFVVGFQLLAGSCQRGISPSVMYHLQLADILLLGKSFFLGAFINGAICVLVMSWLGKLFIRRYRKEALSWIQRTL